jgi:hypothetical protein
MSAPHFWTREKIALLGTDTDGAIAKHLGIAPSQVFLQRSRRGIRAFESLRLGRCKWGQTELGLFRNYTDQEIAKLTGRSVQDVAAKRRSL